MDFVFTIAFFALIAGIIAYTIITYYSTSRTVNGSLLVIAAVVTIPLIALGIIGLVTDLFGEGCRMWALGVVSLSGGFWLKNPRRDFVE